MKLFHRPSLFTVFAVLMLLCGVLLSAGPSRALGSSLGDELEMIVVTVGPGDTLWSIAERYSSPGRDVRDLVGRMRELNGTKGRSLQIGERLNLPMNR